MTESISELLVEIEKMAKFSFFLNVTMKFGKILNIEGTL